VTRIFVDNREIEAPKDFSSMSQILKYVEDSQEKEDFVRIADLLEREIIPLIPIWRGMLCTVAQRAGVTHQAVKSLSNESAECQTYDNGIASMSLDLRP
jgi:hypothetical protein